jgi:hypothetical protein
MYELKAEEDTPEQHISETPVRFFDNSKKAADTYKSSSSLIVNSMDAAALLNNTLSPGK